MIWSQILTSAIVPGIIPAIAAIWTVCTNNAASKKLESLKTTFALSLARKTEFAKKELEVLKTLWAGIQRLKVTLRQFEDSFEFQFPDIEKFNRFCRKLHFYKSYFDKNSIFMEQHVRNNIETLFDAITKKLHSTCDGIDSDEELLDKGDLWGFTKFCNESFEKNCSKIEKAIIARLYPEEVADKKKEQTVSDSES